MGTVRNPPTFLVNRNASSNPTLTDGIGATKNLSKNQLGGVIFGCKNSTFKECLFKQLFGLPAQHISYVKNIDPGLPLFLFNYCERKLYGIYEAASHGQMNINPYGWTTDGSEKTPYPAQVQIRVRLHCQPLLEQQFRPIIEHSYYSHNHFWFELDHTQANKLISLLASLAVSPSTYPQDPTKWRTIIQTLPLTSTDGEGSVMVHSEYSRVKSDTDEDFKPSALEVEHFSQSSRKSDLMDFVPLETRVGSKSIGQDADSKTIGQDEKDQILTKLKELVQKRQNQDITLVDKLEDCTLTQVSDFESGVSSKEQMDLVEKDEDDACSSSHCQSVITQLIQGMEEVKTFKAEQCIKMIQMEQKLVAAELEIQQLKDRCLILESLSNSVGHVNGNKIEPSEKLQLDHTESIFLLGGYDGESWLSAVNSYFPSQDVLKSVQSMSSVRSYASSVELNGEIYVFGGGDGYSWYDTVESYSPSSDQWTLCPSLKEEKGSLAGVVLDGKIFAIGGGNGINCFSDVEMLDLIVGRWIKTRSMLQKRFALAAAELHGAIYATGGFDGNDYLTSVERFDPREHSWTRIAGLSTKRGCHSLVVLNEKLYAVGGYDGSKMISSVEIFDPRLEAWMSGDPINQPRGYAAAAILKGSIYVIGGVKDVEDIIDSVECFNEGEGWQMKTSMAVGKRCFSSAIVLKSQ